MAGYEKPKILLLYTGGTIGMVQDPEAHALRPLDFNHVAKFIPEINRLDIELSTMAFDKPIDSSNVKIDTWVEIANIVKSNQDKDGFVVLHGTDTMSYTASALSFMLEGLDKPVILTGSQLPIGMTRTDGKENVITALEIASQHKRSGLKIPEVCIYFEDLLFRGNRTIKYSAEDFDAFQSPNYPTLAEAGIEIKYNMPYISVPSTNKLRVRTNMESRIAVLHLFPGISDDYLSSFYSIKDLKGLIIHSFGSGNIPDNKMLTELLQSFVEKGVLIYNVTQCLSGSSDRKRYSTNPSLINDNIVDGDDITLEAAITKLMYILGLNLNFDESSYLLSSNLRGEITKKN